MHKSDFFFLYHLITGKTRASIALVPIGFLFHDIIVSSILEEIMRRFSACRDPASHSDCTLAGPFLCTKASLIRSQVSLLEPGEFRRTAGLVAMDEEALTCTR